MFVPEDVYSVKEVSSILRMTQSTVRRWIKGGSLKAVKIGSGEKRRTYKVTGQELNRYLDLK